jgi:hypothetical protein
MQNKNLVVEKVSPDKKKSSNKYIFKIMAKNFEHFTNLRGISRVALYRGSSICPFGMNKILVYSCLIKPTFLYSPLTYGIDWQLDD